MTEIEIQGKNPSEYLIEILNEGEKAVEEGTSVLLFVS